MARSARPTLNSRSILTVLLALTMLFSILPPKFSAWMSVFSSPAATLLSPIQWPITRMIASNVLRSDATTTAIASADEMQRLRTQVSALESNHQQLLKTIQELQSGLAVNVAYNASAVRQYAASVIGPGTDLTSPILRIRAGTSDGLPKTIAEWSHGGQLGGVAIARGSHLVGRVVHIADRYSEVQLITHKDAGSIQGIVMINDATRGPTCQLVKRSAGTLIFELGGDQAIDGARAVDKGQIVRLSDENWPAAAQGYIIGRIESIMPKPENTLRRIIVVRPDIELIRLRDVVIRWLPDSTPPSGGNTR